MPNLLIRDLDPEVHATLAARAQREGRSLQQYLTAELTRLAELPTTAELFDEIDARSDGLALPPDEIVEAIRVGRESRA